MLTLVAVTNGVSGRIWSFGENELKTLGMQISHGENSSDPDWMSV